MQRHRAGVGVILHALNKASTQDSILVLLAANVLIFLLRPCGVTTLTTALGFVVLGASPMPVVRHVGLFSALGLVFGLVAAVVGCTWGLAYDSAVLPVPSDRRGPGERPRRNGRRTAGRSVSSVGANGPVETQKCADRRARPGSPRSKMLFDKQRAETEGDKTDMAGPQA